VPRPFVEKTVFTTNCVKKSGHPHAKKMKISSLSISYVKINSNNSEVKMQQLHYKTLQENIQGNLHEFGFVDYSYPIISKA
jgi:hypothetical protein